MHSHGRWLTIWLARRNVEPGVVQVDVALEALNLSHGNGLPFDCQFDHRLPRAEIMRESHTGRPGGISVHTARECLVGDTDCSLQSQVTGRGQSQQCRIVILHREHRRRAVIQHRVHFHTAIIIHKKTVDPVLLQLQKRA